MNTIKPTWVNQEKEAPDRRLTGVERDTLERRESEFISELHADNITSSIDMLNYINDVAYRLRKSSQHVSEFLSSNREFILFKDFNWIFCGDFIAYDYIKEDGIINLYYSDALEDCYVTAPVWQLEASVSYEFCYFMEEMGKYMQALRDIDTYSTTLEQKLINLENKKGE